MGWTLMIHGGAGSMRRGHLAAADEQAGRAGLAAALEAGAAILRGAGSALDAVEAAVKVLEDDPAFNAGRGSVFTWDGRIECDAAVMDGHTRDAGAVAGVSATRHPVSLARTCCFPPPAPMPSRAIMGRNRRRRTGSPSPNAAGSSTRSRPSLIMPSIRT